MRYIAIYIVTLFMTQVVGLSFNAASAAPSKSHSHNGRIHSHKLPVTGVKHYHKHMHNGRAHIHPYSDKLGFKHSHNGNTTKNPRAKAWENAVRHEHGGRSHIHPFPVTGVKHLHKLSETKTTSSFSPNINSSEKPKMIRGLSIKQQMELLLNTSLQDTKEAKLDQIDPQRRINLRDEKYLALLSNTATSKPTRKVVLKKRSKILKSYKSVKKTSANKRKVSARKGPQAITKLSKPITGNVKQTLKQIEDSNRQFKLAVRYENGTGVKKNLRQAFNWYLRAAKQGNTKAQFSIASLYEKGEGVTLNIPLAIHWYYSAANNGDVNAQVNLGNKYARGNIVPRNINKAAYWYKLAADQGDISGLANLNNLIENNNGVIKR